jgi:uncharacterized protein with HEPN domain
VKDFISDLFDGRVDMVINIDLAHGFIDGLDHEGFLGDIRTSHAVTRRLEIISEASRRLSADLKTRHPEIPWRKVAGSGNIYRHDYEDVVHRLVWRTAPESLPTLRAMAAEELQSANWP